MAPPSRLPGSEPAKTPLSVDSPAEQKDTRLVDPTGQPASDSVITLKMSELEAMLTRVAQSARSGGGSAELNVAAQALKDLKDEVNRTRIHSNSIGEYHGESEFAPEGKRKKQKMKLLYSKVLFLEMQLREEELTPNEINALNAFSLGGEDKEARNGLWTAKLKRDGSSKPQLVINAPHGTMDNRQQLPSLLLICQELLEGKDSANPDSLMSRVATMGETIKELQAQLASRTPALVT